MLPNLFSHSRLRRLSVTALVCFGLALPATADWLVTRDGDRLQTQGPWQVRDQTVVFKDMRGKLSSINLATVDLEASAAATRAAVASRDAQQGAGKPQASIRITNDDIPKASPNVLADARHSLSEGAEQDSAASEKVVLYQTEWCGYCRRAASLLRELDVPFQAKDIEKDAKARKEFQQRGGRGVPVLDIDGAVVHGYREETIRNLVARMKAEEQEATEGEQSSGDA